MRHCTKILGMGVNSKVTARKAVSLMPLCVGQSVVGCLCQSPGEWDPQQQLPSFGSEEHFCDFSIDGKRQKGKGWLTPEQAQWWEAGLSFPRHCSKLSQKPKKTEKMLVSKLPDRKQNPALLSLGWDCEHSHVCVPKAFTDVGGQWDGAGALGDSRWSWQLCLLITLDLLSGNNFQ